MNNVYSEYICEINKKYEHGGRLKFKINILFYGDSSRTAALRQMKFGKMKGTS
jgi:hypothetical protein